MDLEIIWIAYKFIFLKKIFVDTHKRPGASSSVPVNVRVSIACKTCCENTD